MSCTNAHATTVESPARKIEVADRNRTLWRWGADVIAKVGLGGLFHCDLVEESAEAGANPPEFFAMGGRKFREHALSAFGQRNKDLSPVVGCTLSRDELLGDQPIHQTNRTVVPNLQFLREFPDRNSLSSGKTFDREQPLMLLRREPLPRPPPPR